VVGQISIRQLIQLEDTPKFLGLHWSDEGHAQSHALRKSSTYQFHLLTAHRPRKRTKAGNQFGPSGSVLSGAIVRELGLCLDDNTYNDE
jgi:hypothetical protein